MPVIWPDFLPMGEDAIGASMRVLSSHLRPLFFHDENIIQFLLRGRGNIEELMTFTQSIHTRCEGDCEYLDVDYAPKVFLTRTHRPC